ATADAGDEHVRQPALRLEDLCARLRADDRLELAHEPGVGVRAGGAADQVVGVADVRHPAADRLVHGVLQRARAALDDLDLRAEELHAEDVERLTSHVLGAHEDGALHPEHRADGRGGDAVLAGARLGEDLRLAHALREQALRDGVVDLVRARVAEVLALEVDLRAAEPSCEVLGEVQRRRPADVGAEEVPQLRLERLVGARRLERGRELVEGDHQRLGHEAPAVGAEVAELVGEGKGGHTLPRSRWSPNSRASSAARTDRSLDLSSGMLVTLSNASIGPLYGHCAGVWTSRATIGLFRM